MTHTRQRRSAFSMIEILVVLGILALLLAFLLPAVQKVRSAAARSQDTNNQKQIALSIHSFHDTFRKFPFNGTKDSLADPKNLESGSWIFQVLPFIEQQPLFNNPMAGERVKVPVLMTPARTRVGFVTEGKVKGPQSDYAINTWLNDPANGTLAIASRKTTFVNITDGTSNTICLGQLALRTTDYMKTDGAEGRESIFVGGTMGTGRNQPRAVSDGPDIDFANKFGGPFPGITIFAFADGSVRTIRNAVDLRPALTPNGGEAVNID